MAKTPDVIRFQELSDKDRILLTYNDHSRYLHGSIEAMELVDEIRDLDEVLLNIIRPDEPIDYEMDRSSTLISALREVRNRRESQLDDLKLERSLL